MYELNETNPNLNQHQLFQSGMRVGREILATSANTIYLAFSRTINFILLVL